MQFPSHTLISAPSMAGSGAFAPDRVDRLGKVIVIYAEAFRRANSAAALYEGLSRLPNADLARDGMTRGDVNREVFNHLTGD